MTQLRHEAGERQAEGVRVGLIQNSGELIGTDSAVNALHIFEGLQ